MNILYVLSQCSLFKGKTQEEIKELLNQINYSVKHFEKNEIVFSYNQPADRIAIMISGNADIQMVFSTGKLVIVKRKKESDLIAEPSVFSDRENYPSILSVNKSCEIMFIPKSELEKLFKIDYDITMNFIRSISNSALILKDQIEVLSYNSIQEKIACFLIRRYQTSKNYQIYLNFSKKNWASQMNVSRTSLSRELKKLQDENIIKYNKNEITIVNVNALKQIISS